MDKEMNHGAGSRLTDGEKTGTPVSSATGNDGGSTTTVNTPAPVADALGAGSGESDGGTVTVETGDTTTTVQPGQ